MSEKQITALIIIFIYMALTVFIGLWSARKKNKKKAKSDNIDFLMAGKSLGPLVIAGTLFAANTGGASTTGIATNVYSYGISSAWYVIAAGIGFFLVSFFAPYIRKVQANTVPEIIGMRFGKASHILTTFTSITALFLATGAQIMATSSITSVVTGLSFEIATVISTLVVLIYTMIGGFSSVASTNIMHVLFITLGMFVAMLFIVNNNEIGGFQALFDKALSITNTNSNNLDLTSFTKIGFPVVFGYVVMYFMTFSTGQETVQTFCSAKNASSAKIASLIAGGLSTLFALIPAIIGLVAYTCIDGYANTIQKNALADATMQFAPNIIAGIVLAAVIAATISSAASNMIGTATLFTNDIYKPYIKHNKTDDKKEIWISRIIMIITALFALMVTLTASNVISVMMEAFALRSAGPFAAFVFAIFSKKVTKKAAFASILFGTIIAAIWIYALHTPWGLAAMVPGGIAALAIIILISFIERKMGAKPAKPLSFE